MCEKKLSTHLPSTGRRLFVFNRFRTDQFTCDACKPVEHQEYTHQYSTGIYQIYIQSACSCLL